jgi:hypothetical protein
MFAPGDTVRCVNVPVESTTNPLNDHDIYVVDSTDMAGGEQTILVKKFSGLMLGWWLANRFVEKLPS